jgi:3-hydroxybutyryl-CoA dehydratase
MFKKGDIFESKRSYSREDVLAFARLTGDNNPIHIDEEFGKNSQFGRNIVHGNLVVATFSADIGNKFPGPGTIVIQKEIVFIRPVFIGETYTLLSKISSINRNDNTAVIKCFLKSSNGKNCIRVINTIKNEVVFQKL